MNKAVMNIHQNTFNQTFQASPFPMETSSYCSSCGQNHFLSQGRTHRLSLELMELLDKCKRLDFHSEEANPACSTAGLFGSARGKMFGVLEGIDEKGHTSMVYAFSGQYNGLWHIPGWAPPLFNVPAWHRLSDTNEGRIKTLTRELAGLPGHALERRLLQKKRKQLSRLLMRELHDLYRLTNFRGETAGLAPFFGNQRGIPTGAGDCCAPKLLNYAATHNLVPVGMTEFYWGRTNRAGTRHHGNFYPVCESKCHPILGFMLCGLKERQQERRRP